MDILIKAEEGKTQSALAEEVGIKRQNIKTHLDMLIEDGIVEREQRGNTGYYLYIKDDITL